MDRRARGLHRFLVSSPVVLLIAISAVGHLRKPAHIGAAGTADYDRRVLAYRDRVVEAERITDPDGPSNLAALENEAKKWTEGYRSGQLEPLQPVAYEDHLRDGVRGEVFTAGLMLSSKLSANAKTAFENGRYVQAASDSLLATETVLGMREFEFEAYLLCIHSARRSLDTLELTWPHLSAAERLALKPRLEALIVDPKEQETLIDMDERHVNDYFERQGRQNSIVRQGTTPTASLREQSAKTAERATGLFRDSVQKLIGS
jgi:hypothetical protein